MNNIAYPTEYQFTKTVRATGKQYKKWEWVGWGLLPDLNNFEHHRKGQYLIVNVRGQLQRYNIENGVER